MMVVVAKGNLFTFFVITNVFVFGEEIDVDKKLAIHDVEEKSKYKFETKVIPHNTEIKGVIYPRDSRLKDHVLSKLSPKARREMCIAAKEYAELDGMASESEVFPAYGYKLSGGVSAELVGVRCSTIPSSYLYLKNSSDNKIIIMLFQNEYTSEEYSFTPVIVESDPVPVPDDGFRTEVWQRSREVQENYFFKVDIDLLNVCVAAKKRIQYTPMPVLQDTVVEKPQMYDISLPGGNVKHFAVKCPSSPSMYLYLETSEFDIKVLLVKSQHQ